MRLFSACLFGFNPNVAKVGGLQSQGTEGEAVVGYCEASVTPDLESSGFPLGKNMPFNRYNPRTHQWFIATK